MKRVLLLVAVLYPSLASAQVAPGVFTTIKTTSTAATSACIGCPTGTTTPAANSGLTATTIVLPVSGAPSVTTNKLYQIGGALFFNGLGLATGSSISGTANKLAKFTSATVLGDSTVTDTGTAVTVAGTLAATGTITTGTNGAQGIFFINSPTATARPITYQTAGVARWSMRVNQTAESGGNAGSNWRLEAYDDAGVLIGNALAVQRSSMAATFGGTLTVTGVTALNGATTIADSLQLTGAAPVYLGSSANGYLFRNSTNGATILSVTDAGVITLPGATTASTTLSVAGVTRIGTGSTTGGWGTNGFGDFTMGGSSHVSDSTGAPTISVGFGSSPVISGTDYAIKLVSGSGAGNSGGTILFGHSWTTAPVCVANSVSGTIPALSLTTTSTQVVVTYTSGTYTGDGLNILCRSY